VPSCFTAALGFPLLAGAVLVRWGYRAVFGVLVVCALGELAVAVRPAVGRPS